MSGLVITMFSVSAILFILSFTRKDPAKDVEKQLENFSITLMQEMYQLKKKMKTIEEEFVIGNEAASAAETGSVPNELTRDDVLALYEEGFDIKDISKKTNRSEGDIDELLAHNR
ncbi:MULTISPECIES: hypothetical protein [Alteribacter]|uniref:Uncharacterized protein n=1 Tax=Alteribacter keqinensis TaxID=2483800 RepID=A0A3M7TTF1_9BACI|nr:MULTISPECIES: hypothetical protein [Alteribacter]MBM7097046.1 hypothetical protein [Alteribacter salitolerans]RNA68920.1 hypothetical protein EBO34_02865 [Alteribacter keqinensis]